MYSLHVTINYAMDEREFTVEPTSLTQGALEDAIITVMEDNPDATSFVFVVSRRKD